MQYKSATGMWSITCNPSSVSVSNFLFRSIYCVSNHFQHDLILILSLDSLKYSIPQGNADCNDGVSCTVDTCGTDSQCSNTVANDCCGNVSHTWIYQIQCAFLLFVLHWAQFANIELKLVHFFASISVFFVGNLWSRRSNMFCRLWSMGSVHSFTYHYLR